MSVFAPGYADWYDTLYREKDYPGECDLLETLFARSPARPQDILDLGCGTGGHAVLLARRGYRVTAVDRSASMLQAARRKAAAAGVAVDFRAGDVTRLEWHDAFDAAIAMFAVAGYLATDEEMAAFLAGAWRSLRPGGVLIFDGWHGPGVLRERPAPRLLEVPLGADEALLRLAEPRLDAVAQTVEVHYRLWRRRGTALSAAGEERHVMRFFFARELRALLRNAGFAAVDIRPSGCPQRELREDDWHFTAVAGKEK